MKKLLLLLLILPAFALYAQEEVVDTTALDNSEDCARSTSIYYEYYKAKNYVEAYPNWKFVVDNCKDFNPGVYIHGTTMIDNLLRDKTLTPEKRKEYVDVLIATYKKRLEKHPEVRPAMVLTRRALSKYNNQIVGNQEIINIIKQAIEKVQSGISNETLDAVIFDVYFVLALKLYNAKEYSLSQCLTSTTK